MIGPSEPKKRRSVAWGFMLAGIAAVIALLVVGHRVAPALPFPFITSYCMKGGGSVPTLLVGECFEARTLAFRDRLPRRGELAVLRIPSGPDVDFVRRIIGRPGDRIQMREGRLYLNGDLIERTPIGAMEATPLLEDLEQAKVYRETLPGGASYLVAEFGDDRGLDNTPEFVVPADHVFVLGDNRDGSNDSRGSLGFIPFAALHDKPLFIYWSADKSRIGKMLE